MQITQKSGSIPFSANRSLVTITARERRRIVNNGFASTPHLFVFDALGKERSAPIQRIMSVPMLKEEELRGVIRACRKGEKDAEPKSFSEHELSAPGKIASIIAGHL